jgi:hypothetical protein
MMGQAVGETLSFHTASKMSSYSFESTGRALTKELANLSWQASLMASVNFFIPNKQNVMYRR